MCVLAFVIGILLATAAVSDPAFAIPAPDLIVGSISSASQLLALLSVVLGGGALAGSRLRRAAGPHGLAPAARWLNWAFAGTLVLLVGSIGFNVHQWLDQAAERDARLQATLTRPAKERGKPLVDPSMKELSYEEQTKHPQGIGTDETAALLAAAEAGTIKNINFLDVREPAEFVMGGIPGFTPVRWPDLAAASARLDLKNRRNIVFCHNGNRSYETCDDLVAQGIPCEFIVGGFEKWYVEGRPVTGVQSRTFETLRPVPPYRNDKTLLDTPEVKRLIEKEEAVFVDVRYQREFAAGHLPDAINVPIRRTPTPELEAMIADLPRRPVIVPCYDRRGCFFSEVLGYELDRRGFDFRGRYTVPFEYFEAKSLAKARPHVAKWRAEIERTPFDRAVVALSEGIAWLSRPFESLIAGIIGLALLSRLIVLPVSLKAERDQTIARTLAPQLAGLKARLAHDPKRLLRALRAVHRRHRMTPGRNLLALVFLPLFLISVTAIDLAAKLQPEALLWMESLSAPDPLYALPALFACLICLYLHLAVAHTPKARALTWLVGGPLLAAAMLGLSAAANLYAVASAVLLLIQQRWVAAVLNQREGPRAGNGNYLVPLAEAHVAEGTGNKAARLGRLIEAGFPVPDGFVIAGRAFANGSGTARLSSEHAAAAAALCRRLGLARVAVRSSGMREDGDARSFAGVFDSILDVSPADLRRTIDEVQASFASARAASYAGHPESGGVLVQRMIDAEYAGVLFTESPSGAGACLVEMVAGNGHKLVSGATTPIAFSFGRSTGRPDGAAAPIDLGPLLALGRRAERVFGGQQDIEWAYRQGQFHILQSRDITRPLAAAGQPGDLVEGERRRLLALAEGGVPEEIVLAQTEFSELVPRPTASTLSLLESLWRAGGSVDLACRALGLAYRVEEDSPPYLATVFGRLYANKLEERRRLGRVPAWVAYRISRAGEAIEREFSHDFLPDYLKDVRLLEIADLDRMSVAELTETLETTWQRFLTRTHPQAEIVNIAASVYLDEARRRLTGRGLDPAKYLAGIPETAMTRALAEAQLEADRERRLDLFLDRFGHRAQIDYELSCPRYREDRRLAEHLMVSWQSAGLARAPGGDALDARGWRDRALAATLARARRFQALKEDAKHHCLRELAALRSLLLALDRRLFGDGSVFHLTLDETVRLADPQFAEEAAHLARRRCEDYERCKTVNGVPAELTPRLVETLRFGEPARPAGATNGTLKGTLVAGTGPVVGRARVIPAMDAENGVDLVPLGDGEIVVSRLIPPLWSTHFPRAAGLVCEVGGWLSHTAILAREYRLPMIVGVHGWESIADGETVRLNADGTVERLGNASARTDVPPA